MKRDVLKFRKSDLLAAALILLVALLTCALLPRLMQTGEFASVYQDGELIRRVPLTVDQTFSVTGDYTNTVTVKDGKIAVTVSDCPTNDCVHQGWRSSGGAIICLPNRVEIRLPSDGTVDISVP